MIVEPVLKLDLDCIYQNSVTWLKQTTGLKYIMYKNNVSVGCRGQYYLYSSFAVYRKIIIVYFIFFLLKELKEKEIVKAF